MLICRILRSCLFCCADCDCWWMVIGVFWGVLGIGVLVADVICEPAGRRPEAGRRKTANLGPPFWGQGEGVVIYPSFRRGTPTANGPLRLEQLQLYAPTSDSSDEDEGSFKRNWRRRQDKSQDTKS